MSKILGKFIEDLTITTGNLANSLITPSKMDPNAEFTLNSLIVSTDATVSEVLSVTGEAHFLSDATVSNNLSVGQTNFMSDASVINDLRVDGTSFLNDTTTENLYVDGTTQTNSLIVEEIQGIVSTGDVTCNQNLLVSGIANFLDATMSNNLRVEGLASLASIDLETLSISDATVTDRFYCTGDSTLSGNTQTRNLEAESSSYHIGLTSPYGSIGAGTVNADNINTSSKVRSVYLDCTYSRMNDLTLYSGTSYTIPTFSVGTLGDATIGSPIIDTSLDINSSSTIIRNDATIMGGLDSTGTSYLKEIKWGPDRVSFGEFEAFTPTSVSVGLPAQNTATGFGVSTDLAWEIGKFGEMGLIRGVITVTYSGGSLYDVDIFLPSSIIVVDAAGSPAMPIVNFPNDGTISYVIHPAADNVLRISSMGTTVAHQGTDTIATGMKFYINNMFKCTITT